MTGLTAACRAAWRASTSACRSASNQFIAQRKQRKIMKANYDFSEGRRGALIPQKGKTRISIFIDHAVLDEFRKRAEKTGIGYQAMMNEALRSFLA